MYINKYHGAKFCAATGWSAWVCWNKCVCAGGGDKRRGLRRAIKRKNMKERGGGHFQIQQSLCWEQSSRDLTYASLPLTHGALEITGRSWEFGFCCLFWVAITHERVFIWLIGSKQKLESWNCKGTELSFSATGLFYSGTLSFLILYAFTVINYIHHLTYF